MSSLSIEVEVSGGASITDAAKEAIALANQLKIIVKFEFNGILVRVSRYASVLQVEKEYFETCNKIDKL